MSAPSVPHDSGMAGRLRELLAAPGIIRSLGAHDVFTALIVERAGFETVFIGGFGTSASMLGLPDLNFLTMTEMADAVRRMAARVRIPVIADGDTGHGDLHNVQRTVATFERAGAAGILIEDQVAPKRCGHFEGKQVIPAEEIQTLLDNIGIPYSGLNLSLSEGALISPADGEIFIALRKEHPVFGLGSYEPLPTDNTRIFAHMRTWEEDIVLCVHNLARSAQAVQLDLSKYAGMVPVEMLGRTAFPPIGELPYLLTLAPRGFFWFQLRQAEQVD